VDKFFVAHSWILGSNLQHLGWGLVSAVADGSPLGFVAGGERFRLKVFRLVEGQVGKPEHFETSTCFIKNERNMHS
jgi:hypothetical protein